MVISATLMPEVPRSTARMSCSVGVGMRSSFESKHEIGSGQVWTNADKVGNVHWLLVIARPKGNPAAKELSLNFTVYLLFFAPPGRKTTDKRRKVPGCRRRKLRFG
jgi:hypothetical protein